MFECCQKCLAEYSQTKWATGFINENVLILAINHVNLTLNKIKPTTILENVSKYRLEFMHKNK